MAEKKITFRTLNADEIECRIGRITENGLMLLLYKNARVDMDLLDETVGAMNWKREHYRDNANCVVSVYDSDKNEWVSKEDTGTESNTEKEKGLASDSFKRACVNWGIGRELYSAPFIWVASGNYKDKNGKCYDEFIVKEITYTKDRKIDKLVIENKTMSKVVYDNGKTIKADKKETKAEPKKEEPKKDKPTMEMLKDLHAKLNSIADKEFTDGIISMYNLEDGISKIDDMQVFIDITQLVDNKLEKMRENAK